MNRMILVWLGYSVDVDVVVGETTVVLVMAFPMTTRDRKSNNVDEINVS